MYYMGLVGYLTERSTRETMGRNASLQWAVGFSWFVSERDDP